MNKFSEIRQGGIRDDLMFIKRFGFNKKLSNDLWSKLGASPREEVEVEVDKHRKKKFISHPKRLESDTDDNSVFSTPRRISVSSSVLDLNTDCGANQLKPKKKLHKTLTQTDYNEICHVDFGIGDSNTITPRCAASGGQVHFEKQKHEKNVTEVTKSKFRNVTTAPGTKLNLSRAPSVQTSQRNIMITESVFEKKFKTFVEKSLHIISDVRSTLDRGVPPPDGDEDMSRRTIRVKEFSNRFSRNYLYPLARQMDDLSKLDPHNVKVHHKLLSAYNVILNGLQAYHNHLPSSIGTCSSDKLKILLSHVLQLCDIHNALIKHPDENGFSDFVSTYKLNAELTLKKIDDYFTAPSTHSMLKTTTKLSLGGFGGTKTNKPKIKEMKSAQALESRLSMYSVTAAFRKDSQWKKAVDTYTRKKFNVKSRYKTATYRHRPPVEKVPEILVLQGRSKLFGKRSNAALKKTPPTTPVGDNITTMVQIENGKFDQEEKDFNSDEVDKKNVNETLIHKEIVMKLLHLVLDNTQRKAAEKEHNGTHSEAVASTDSQIAEILQQLRNEGNIEALQKVLDTLQRKTAEPNELQLKIIESPNSLEGGGKKRKEPIVTVTGQNNVRLICIKDENSIIDIESNSESEKKDCQTEKVISLRVSSSKTRTDLKKKEKVHKHSQKPTKNAHSKMNRLPKSSKCLQHLPKSYAVHVIQYKLDFSKHCKTNPLYRKTASVTPWILMGTISDKILDHALLTVAREIEVNDIAQQIYDSELQL